MIQDEKIEPMLVESSSRFTIFPIKYPDIWEAYKKQEAMFWSAEEIDYSGDISDWGKLTTDEKFFIENILAFFAGSDGIVLENLMSNFSKEVQWPEARFFYGAQAYIEQVHSQVYSQLIDTLIKDPDRKQQLFSAINTIPCVAEKANFALRWMSPERNKFSERLVAFIVVEGVFFSGAFCSIFWLKSRNLLTCGLTKSNEFISRDEGIHCNFGVLLYSHLVNKLSTERLHQIFKEAVEIETKFICTSIPCKLIGMNSTLMVQYIKYVADYWLKKLGYPKLYNETNPFDFMDMNSIDNKTNFFEKRVTEYQKPYSATSVADRKLDLDDDF